MGEDTLERTEKKELKRTLFASQCSNHQGLEFSGTNFNLMPLFKIEVGVCVYIHRYIFNIVFEL